MSEPLDLFGNPLPAPEEAVTQEKPERVTNPCLALYGLGPDGQTCKGCVHLRYQSSANPNKRYWKCDLRRLSHGKATDHKVGWSACGRYEARIEDYHGG